MNVDLKELRNACKDLHLLYVEDDVKARTIMLEMLEHLFTHITLATDGQDGLEKFKNASFDLIITDINMPRLTGVEMLTKIRSFDTKILVVVLSAYNEPELFLQTLRLGVDDFIIKPIEHNQFLNSLKKTTDKIKLLKQLQAHHQDLEDEVKKRTKELQTKLYYDDLTSLFSRYSFFEDIKEMQNPIIFLLDIDRFKLVNEIYGLEIGSIVLQEFAKFLLKFTQNSHFRVYRVSSDEFVLLEDTLDVDYSVYEHLVDDFFQKLSNFQVLLQDDFITIDVTIGISIAQKYPLECAKIALENAKENQKSYTTYSLSMNKKDEKRDALLWKHKIKSAIEENRIIPVYQAIVNESRGIVKYETLMRLEDAQTQELISPYFFLDIALKTKLYNSLSATIIFKALKLAHETDTILSVNFTFTDIKNKYFIQSIAEYIKEHKDVGTKLVFEITESENIESFKLVKEFIHKFRMFGVKFAIDDFGSGYSNFEHILEIQPDYLKIDGSLVKHIDTDKSSYILVKAIIDFSHKLGITVIAEYVHSETIFTLLKELHVDEYQGFYFYEPQQKLLKC